ncbi:hypothetical protein RJ639_022159 [Escallonia herrerae]|uniref:Clp R domain-containing protein n=1 Tax=Escallonia herrerae TaxID=1293975 RepID=A0AA89AFT1_9ASTE|nr:hypothetical protein RJ639_022159 [Escallonia herrerae]
MAAHTLASIPVSHSAFHSCCIIPKKPTSHAPRGSKLDNLVSSFPGTKLSIRPSNSRQPIRKHHQSTVATASPSLPVAKPEGTTSEKAPNDWGRYFAEVYRWSARAIKSYAMGELEARKLKYSHTGTEALLMGILVEGTSLAAKFLRQNGVTLFQVREETVKLLGKSDMYFFSPEHPPLTDQAQRAVNWAIDAKLKSGEPGEITVSHLLLGIWSEKESAGRKIMATFGFDDEKANELAKTMNKDIVLSFKKGL